jgi:hypothetical protein
MCYKEIISFALKLIQFGVRDSLRVYNILDHADPGKVVMIYVFLLLNDLLLNTLDIVTLVAEGS